MIKKIVLWFKIRYKYIPAIRRKLETLEVFPGYRLYLDYLSSVCGGSGNVDQVLKTMVQCRILTSFRNPAKHHRNMVSITLNPAKFPLVVKRIKKHNAFLASKEKLETRQIMTGNPA